LEVLMRIFISWIGWWSVSPFFSYFLKFCCNDCYPFLGGFFDFFQLFYWFLNLYYQSSFLLFVCLSVLFRLFAVLRIQPWPLSMLSMCSATELHPTWNRDFCEVFYSTWIIIISELYSPRSTFPTNRKTKWHVKIVDWWEVAFSMGHQATTCGPSLLWLDYHSLRGKLSGFPLRTNARWLIYCLWKGEEVSEELTSCFSSCFQLFSVFSQTYHTLAWSHTGALLKRLACFCSAGASCDTLGCCLFKLLVSSVY
jgi:hypothetical protein